MHNHASQAKRVIEAVGEPPAAFPSVTTARVVGQIEIDVDCRKKRVVQAQHGRAINEPVDFILYHKFVMSILVHHLEVLVAKHCRIDYHHKFTVAISRQKMYIVETFERL
jgi:hypothetical protein